ncbi:PREDICTED: uncharacterized protein LOC108760774 [Trachymyrmex cornetzi]|uniref:uncharacterized protein LOC108760774 n=1 Tax=Trachymyrmex cornetzi TaxID=471704 RepID=UPI00084EE9F4|nr:PREDICTED: uncharacterized protein LOC108760774 [Trachymyrmex cornetzi]
MEIEDIDDLRDFVTIYKKDYLGKTSKRTTKRKLLAKYLPSLNILNRPYKQYLHTRLENRLLSENERSEDPVDNLNRIRDKFPHLRNALPEIVPNEIVIKNNKEKSMKTIYQQDYSKEFRKDHRRREITLPQNWIIPETIQKRAYRNPWIIATKELIKPSKIFKSRNNLDPNPKEREILRVTTGNSEYTGTIGIAGENIMLRSRPSNTRNHASGL